MDRIGHCAANSSCPPWAPSRWHFTAAGHGDADPTFLEVLEQEAEDRRHRRIRTGAPGIPAALGQDLGNLRATESPWRCGSNLTSFVERHQRAGLRAARHRHRPGPPPGGSWPLRPPLRRLVQELLAAKPAPPAAHRWTTSTSCSSTTWALPRAPRSLPGPYPHRRTLRAPVVGHTSNLVFVRERIPNPMATLPRRLTGSCTTPSSWSLTCPATGQRCPATRPGQGGEPAKLRGTPGPQR